MEKEEYIIRRENLIKKLENNSVAIIFGGVEKKSSEDATYPFEINRHFYYLTGVDQDNSVLLIVKTEFEVQEYLFIDEKDPKVEKWIGIKLSDAEAQEISGIKNVLFRNSLKGKMETIFDENGSHFGLIKNVYLDLSSELKIAKDLDTILLKKQLLEKYHARFNVLDIYPLITKMRMKKSKEEIKMIVEAIKTTEVGLKNVLKELSPGRYEYNLRNVFEFHVKEDLNASIAFPSIVSSGKNSTILHYVDCNDLLKPNELVLLDVGATHQYYCGDISRTYPISGKFSEMQKKIYNIVLGCNKATIKFMRPGLTLKEINDFAKNYLAEEAFALGLISNVNEINQIYYHNVSHHLGLDTHDASFREMPLEEGNVITCEPGLYLASLGIGIRIEDDVLITNSGSINLSQDIIKEVDDIERFLQAK